MRARSRLAVSTIERASYGAVGIGSDDYEKELRTGLAMGADRALLVRCSEPLDPWNVARLLQAVVERQPTSRQIQSDSRVKDTDGVGAERSPDGDRGHRRHHQRATPPCGTCALSRRPRRHAAPSHRREHTRPVESPAGNQPRESNQTVPAR